MLTGSGKSNISLITFSFVWVIDSRAIVHMTCNSDLFTMFQSYLSTSTVTLAYGSTSCVFGLGQFHVTSHITLTSVINLPQFYFNLIYVSKLTRTLNCSIAFIPNYCLVIAYIYFTYRVVIY